MKLSQLCLFGICMGLATSIFATGGGTAVAGFSPQQVKQIEQITHDYIVNNPQTIVESMKKLQQEAMQKESGKIKQAVADNKKEVFAANVPGRAAIGSNNANVMMVEFFSYQCPNCRVMGQEVDKLMQDNKDLQVIFVAWPFENNDDVYAAQNTLAAQKQGKFYEFHQTLMAAPSVLTKDEIDKFAKSVTGLNTTKLTQDANDKVIQNGIKSNFELAQKLGIEGTPVFMFTNKALTKFSVVPGRSSHEDLQKALNEVR